MLARETLEDAVYSNYYKGVVIEARAVGVCERHILHGSTMPSTLVVFGGYPLALGCYPAASPFQLLLLRPTGTGGGSRSRSGSRSGSRCSSPTAAAITAGWVAA